MGDEAGAGDCGPMFLCQFLANQIRLLFPIPHTVSSGAVPIWLRVSLCQLLQSLESLLDYLVRLSWRPTVRRS